MSNFKVIPKNPAVNNHSAAAKKSKDIQKIVDEGLTGASRPLPHYSLIKSAFGNPDRNNIQSKRDIPTQTSASHAASSVQFSSTAQPAPKSQNIQQIAASGTNGLAQPLPHLQQIQKSFGAYDVTNVKAYTDAKAATANHALGSKAYANGNSIAFSNSPSLHTAAHEAAHIIQQRNNVNLKNGVGQVGDRYEQEADKIADTVSKGGNAECLLANYKTHQNTVTKNNVQRLIDSSSKPASDKKDETIKGRLDSEVLYWDSNDPEIKYYFSGEKANDAIVNFLYLLRKNSLIIWELNIKMH